jgi:MoxR-like ATPase
MSRKATLVALQTGDPTHIYGGPGIGKTSFMKAVALATGRHLETYIASTHEPSDVIGLPVIQADGSVRFAEGDWVRRIIEAHEAGQESILFMDEISTAPPAVQAACLRVVNEKVVGTVELPDELWIALASNPVDTSAGTWLLSAAMANRMIHINWSVDSEEWVKGMIEGFSVDKDIAILPPAWREGIDQMRILFSSFIKANPTKLYVQPTNAEDAGKAWPSPRTWDMASRLLAASRAVALDQTEEMTLVRGVVGEGSAIEFLSWERELDLPDPAFVLKNPDDYPIPPRGDQVFAVMTSVVNHTKNHMSPAMWDACWHVLARAADKGHADLAALPARMLGAERQEGYAIPQHVKSFLPVLKAAGLLK